MEHMDIFSNALVNITSLYYVILNSNRQKISEASYFCKFNNNKSSPEKIKSGILPIFF